MKTLNIQITENDSLKYGLYQKKLTFPELVVLIENKLISENLNSCLNIAKTYGLSKLSMEDISEEVDLARKDAKNHH